MPIDSSIAMGVKPPQIESPMNALTAALQAQGLKSQNEVAQYTLAKAQRSDADMNALMQHLAGGGDLSTPEGQAAAMRVAPLSAPALIKSNLEQLKTRSDIAKNTSDTQAKDVETAHKRVDLMGQTLGFVKNNPTLENAQLAVKYLTDNGIMTPDKAKEALAQFQADPSPAGIAKFATLGYTAALSAKEQLPTFQTRNTGGSTDTLKIDPVTGAVTVASSVKNTVSPDAQLQAATTRRGQNMVDARSRESTDAAMSKPFEITGEDGKPVLVQQDKQGNIRPVQGYTPKQGASKPLTDTQAKALQFGSRMQAAEDVFTELEKNGITTSVPGSRAGYGIGAVVNALQPADRQRLDQAKRDFINAVLRRESGAAISPSEFDSAERQYFPQPGETDPKTLAQKRSNRQLATRGILAEVPDSENRVAKVRGPAAAPATDSSHIDSLLDKYK